MENFQTLKSKILTCMTGTEFVRVIYSYMSLSYYFLQTRHVFFLPGGKSKPLTAVGGPGPPPAPDPLLHPSLSQEPTPYIGIILAGMLSGDSNVILKQKIQLFLHLRFPEAWKQIHYMVVCITKSQGNRCFTEHKIPIMHCAVSSFQVSDWQMGSGVAGDYWNTPCITGIAPESIPFHIM